MQFVITAYDGEGMLAKRMEVRPLHLEGMERLKEHLIAAGGLLDDEGKLKVLFSLWSFKTVTSLTNTSPMRYTSRNTSGRRLPLSV